MAASNAVIICDALTGQPLRVILCDDDSQLTLRNGPCATRKGEATVLIPMPTYSTLSAPVEQSLELQTAIQAQIGVAITLVPPVVIDPVVATDPPTTTDPAPAA